MDGEEEGGSLIPMSLRLFLSLSLSPSLFMHASPSNATLLGAAIVVEMQAIEQMQMLTCMFVKDRVCECVFMFH